MLIYCIDKNYKDSLIKKGLHFIKEEVIDGRVVYLFAMNEKINFDKLDKGKVLKSNKMNFGGKNI